MKVEWRCITMVRKLGTVYYNGVWVHCVMKDGDLDDAQVVCRKLDYAWSTDCC